MTSAPEQSKCRIVVMASGNGSNFQALADAINEGRLPNASIVRLITSSKKAFALERARKLGIPGECFNRIAQGFQKSGEAITEEAKGRYDTALAAKILERRPQLVVLAGWMLVFTEKFLDPLTAAGVRVINLHPALPGKYDGAGAIERAFKDFEQGKLEGGKSGIMVHNVIREVDQGQPIKVVEVEAREGDTLEKFEERIHANEHQLIVDATNIVVREILAKQAGY